MKDIYSGVLFVVMEASLPYSDSLAELESAGLDKTFVGSSYFGLKSVVVSHCLRNLDYVRALEDDPAVLAAFCKTVVMRDDEPAFDDVRRRYDQLVKDVYECMMNIPMGQVCELSESPTIQAYRDFQDVLIDMKGCREGLNGLVADKQYSDSIILLAHFMVEQ